MAASGAAHWPQNRMPDGFSAWQRNPAFAADAFSFTPPDGVDVVGEPVTKAQVVPVAD